MLVNIHFSKHHIWKPSQGPQKTIRFNNNTLFCTFLCRQRTITTWKCLFSRFVGDVKNAFFFSELRYSQSRILLHKNLLTFDELYQGGKISAIRFESARNHFLRDVFVAVPVAVVERVRERGVKLHQVVHEVWLVSYHMRVTPSNS